MNTSRPRSKLMNPLVFIRNRDKLRPDGQLGSYNILLRNITEDCELKGRQPNLE